MTHPTSVFPVPTTAVPAPVPPRGPGELPARPLQRSPGGILVPPAPSGVHAPGAAAGRHASPDRAPAVGSAARRAQVIRDLGLTFEANRVADDLSADLGVGTGFAYGFVNLFGVEQTFIGLYQPPPGAGYVTVGRSMPLDHGWCPEVVQRGRALPLHDVYACTRFASNPVVDAVGIRSYFGAPWIYQGARGTKPVTLGTVCVIDPDPRSESDARRLQDLVKKAVRTISDALIGKAPAS